MSITQSKPKSEYGSRGLIELVYSDPVKRTYTGNINAIESNIVVCTNATIEVVQ